MIDPSKNIPTVSSNSEVWVQWHKDLKSVFGKKKANSIWVVAWAKRGGIDSPANTRSLSNYMEGQGVDISRTTFSEITESISDFGSGIFTFGKIALIGGLTVSAIVLLLIMRALLKNPDKSIQGAMMFTPQGRAVSMAKGIK
jgi:hypothetical protein